MSAAVWLPFAISLSGTREIKGPQHSPAIVRWLVELGAWWRDDETPWCGVFVAIVFRRACKDLPKAWYRAKSWLDWGVPLKEPAIGCVVVFEREGGGHVGLVVGQTAVGQLLVLGGNQGDEVNVRAFSRSRVLGYRWPSNWPLPLIEALPVLATNAPLSTSEA